MTTIKHAALGSATNALTTELDSLANNTNTAASAAIDNTTNLDIYIDVELSVATQSVARSAGAVIYLYMAASIDGSTYPDIREDTCELIAAFPLDAATTSRVLTRRDIPIPPGKFKLFARNATGQSLATGNTVRYAAHDLQNV